MADYLTVPKDYQTQHRLTEMFGGLHAVRDQGAAEAAVLMESLGTNHGFLDGNTRIAFTAADVFLRPNGFYIEVEGLDGYAFIYGSMDRHEFRFAQILDWIRQHLKPLI